MEGLIVLIFIIGYLFIALEHPVKINKTATALVTGVLCWTLFALDTPHGGLLSSHTYTTFVQSLRDAADMPTRDVYEGFIRSELSHHLSQIAAIIFFLMGAMTIVELIDAHHGFRFITEMIKTLDIRKLL